MSVQTPRVTNKNLLLGVSGGIAAYKSVELARRLVQAGFTVQVVLTEAGTEFVSVLALQAVTGRAVRQSLFDAQAEAGMSHIELAKWADVLLIAPASADIVARLAHGLANDLLTTLVLATSAQVVLSPAMNGRMWRHPAVQANLALLSERGVEIVPPDVGALACGAVDIGRLPSVEVLVDFVSTLSVIPQLLLGKRVLITAGPTFEDIDPVRFIGNRSSGKMGYALAEVARAMGAEVTLISGPTALASPAGVHCIRVRSAEEMFAEVKTCFSNQDWFISAAAVADYRVMERAEQKLKKQADSTLTLTLIQNPDIVAWAGHQVNRGRVIAFSAETESLLDNARAKLVRKGVDAVLANWVSEGRGFEQAENQLFLISAQGEFDLGSMSKALLAEQVWQALLRLEFLSSER